MPSYNRAPSCMLQAVLAQGSDERSDEVRRRYVKVLRIVNGHLPPRAEPMETWMLDRGCPRRLGPM